MLLKTTMIVTILAMAGSLSHPALAQSYKFKTLNLSQTGSTYLEGVNQPGQIIGDTFSQCFLITGRTRTLVYNGHSEFCAGLNASATIVGTYYPRPHTPGIGFIYQNGSFKDVIPPGSSGQSTAFGVSDSGLITGSYNDQAGVQHGYVFDGKIYQTIDVANATSTTGIGINNAGQITLFTTDSSTNIHSYLKSGSTIQEIVVPGSTSNYANAINNQGQVALCWSTANGASHGGVYDSKKNIYYQIDYPGKSGTCIYGINDHQSLVGTYFSPQNTGQYDGFVATGHLPRN